MFLYHHSSEFKYQTSISLGYILLECSMLKNKMLDLLICVSSKIFSNFGLGVRKNTQLFLK